MALPQRGTDTIAPAGLPNVGGPVSIPQEAFGDATGIDLAGFQQQMTQIVQRERAKADQTVLLDTDNQLSKLQSDLHVQATSLRGKDALGAAKVVADGWEKGVSKITGALKTDQQQTAFLARVSQRWQHLYGAVAEHTEAQTRAFAQQTHEDGLANAANEAVRFYTNPDLVRDKIADTKAIVANYGAAVGWSADTIKAHTADRVSRIHLGIVDRMLAVGDDQAATKYYRAAQGEVQGEDQAKVEKALDLGSTRGISMREGDSLMKTAVSMEAAFATITARAQDPSDPMFNPKVREWTEERIRRLYADKKQAITMKHELAYDTATQIITKTKDFSQIPPATLLDLSATEISQLRREEHLLRHPEKITDEDAYYSLMNEAGLNDATRIVFMNRNLSSLRGRFNDRDFHQLINLQRQLRQQSGRIADSEEKAATKKNEKAARTNAAAEAVRAMMKPGAGQVPGQSPRVPGAPLQRMAAPFDKNTIDLSKPTPPPTAPMPSGNPRTVQVPQSWTDRAKRNPAYRSYLEHMGVKVQ